jgi:small-conductance mechanosensitive channel
MRRVMGGDRAQSRAVVTFTLSAARIAVSLGALYILLLASLSLFETTRPFRDRLALWAASPFRTMGTRLVQGLPNLILLLVLLGVLRAGWQAMSVAFTRISRNEGRHAVKGYQLVPYRLLARVALVTGALLMLPLALGVEMGLFTAVGLLLLCVIGLASLPLLANVGVGLYALVTNQFPMGNWVRVRLPSGNELSGEVTSVDFFHLRLVPEGIGEVRIPHLLALWSAVDHLPNTRALAVEVSVPRERLEPRPALVALAAAAAQAAKGHQVTSAPAVELLELSADSARFRVSLPEASESLRTPLLLALSEVGAPVRPEAPGPGRTSAGRVSSGRTGAPTSESASKSGVRRDSLASGRETRKRAWSGVSAKSSTEGALFTSCDLAAPAAAAASASRAGLGSSRSRGTSTSTIKARVLGR